MSAAKNLSIRLAAVGGDKVRQEFKALGNDGQKAFRQITNVITPANDNLLKLNENTKVFNNILRQASYVAGAFLGFKGISGTLGALFESNRNFEQLSASLKTVIGSTENAQAAFTLIENFATATPYQLNEVVEAFIRLKALGLDPSEEALTSYGNTASAFSKNILDFVEAVADATVGEFERLKSFGIKANTLTNEVKFTFAGVTTTVKKNATDIEKYLRSLGDIKFAGAMSEQMKTMNGVISNIEDNFDKIYRDIGKNGLNEALKSSLTQFNELVGQSGNAATVIGETLATAVEVASGAFFTLAENADIALGLIATRLGGSAISAGWVALSGSVTKLNGGMALLGTTSKSAIAGLTMMSQVSKMAAVQMALTAGVANTLKVALSLIGGPAGLAIIAGYSLYKLADSHNVAKRASKQHAETLNELKQSLEKTVQEVNNLNEAGKNEAVATWSKALKDAEQNIKDLEKSLKNTGGVSLFQRVKPDIFKQEWEIMAGDLRRMLSESRIDLEQYQERVWELAKDYPDFTPMAKSIQENILLLKAARIDANKAREELANIENPPKEEVTTEVKVTPRVDDNTYKKTIDDIQNKLLDLKTPYDKAIALADKWKSETLKGLDSTKSGYQQYKSDAERIYDDMIKKAEESALNSSKSLEDGFRRGFTSIREEAGNFANLAESTVKNAFSNMEDALTTFVTTGKASFSDFANAIISDLTRIIIRQSITQPLLNGIASYFGFATAHTGGIVGSDNLRKTYAGPAVFFNAPKFHGGGIVGDEVPIIAKRGEGVFTREQMKAIGDRESTVNISVNVINNASSDVKTSVTKSNQGNGKINLDIMIEKIENSMAKNVSKGTGLAPVLERRYGLNPAYGSYG